MMRLILVLTVLFCAAFAVPTEVKDVKAVEAAEDAPEEQVVEDAVAEAPEDTELVAAAPMSEEEEEVAPADARSNFCPDGWSFHGSHCFLFVDTSTSWFSAEEHCQSLGGHLASAHNPGEYSFLQELTKTEGQSFAWLGGFYLQGRWLWIDRQGMYYENWLNQNSPFTSHSCVYLRASTGWRNTACTTSWPFICSKSPFSR